LLLVVGQVVATNPAAPVRGPKYTVSKGKTPVLAQEEARELLDSLDASTIVGLRDRALIATMIYTFGRVGAVTKMRVEDYYTQGRRGSVRLHEKGGKRREMPCNHNLEACLDAYKCRRPRRGLKGLPLSDRRGAPPRSTTRSTVIEEAKECVPERSGCLAPYISRLLVC
jgi:site-specific recombinase XerD